MLLHKLQFIYFVMRGGEDKMVDIYVALIIYGLKNINQVPNLLKGAVLAKLNVLGLDGFGQEIVE